MMAADAARSSFDTPFDSPQGVVQSIKIYDKFMSLICLIYAKYVSNSVQECVKFMSKYAFIHGKGVSKRHLRTSIAR